jgi:flagellar motor component MotA
MFSKSELLDAIEELEMSPATYQNAEKLATFYALYDHLYVRKEPMERIESINEVVVDDYGDSEFLQSVMGRKADQIWMVMDELMETVKVLQPKLYQATIDRLKEQ